MRLRSQHGELGDAEARFLAEHGTRAKSDGTREWCFDPLHRTPSPLPFRADAFLALLAHIEVPTLVVRGELGFATSDHDARVAAIPRARAITLPATGHMMHWQRPAELAAHIREHAGAP